MSSWSRVAFGAGLSITIMSVPPSPSAFFSEAKMWDDVKS
jgi:hypothetical protein